jgi:hypothetical protein
MHIIKLTIKACSERFGEIFSAYKEDLRDGSMSERDQAVSMLNKVQGKDPKAFSGSDKVKINITLEVTPTDRRQLKNREIKVVCSATGGCEIDGEGLQGRGKNLQEAVPDYIKQWILGPFERSTDEIF